MYFVRYSVLFFSKVKAVISRAQVRFAVYKNRIKPGTESRHRNYSPKFSASYSRLNKSCHEGPP